MKKRLFTPPKQSYFLFGPRGTGKSTLVKQAHKKVHYIDLLDSAVMARYQAFPEDLIKVVEALKKPCTVIIDEIQKVPALLSNIHLLIERKKKIQFVLTGSSTRKLKRSGVDLMAGRALLEYLFPYLACELKEEFNFERALEFGLIPLIWESEEPAKQLASYVGAYIKEEVQQEALVRHIGEFSRFLYTLAFSHAQQLNVANISRECSVKRTTLDSFLDIAEDLLLTSRLPVLTHRAKRELVHHPKFYFFDCGVFRALRKRGPGDTVEDIEGSALEGLVFQHLKAWCSYTRGSHDLYFWRTKAGLEVDFIIFGDLGFWAIEVKNNQRIHPQDVRPLLHFIEDYPEAIPLLLYRGTERIIEKNVLCMPVKEFLQMLAINQALPI